MTSISGQSHNVVSTIDTAPCDVNDSSVDKSFGVTRVDKSFGVTRVGFNSFCCSTTFFLCTVNSSSFVGRIVEFGTNGRIVVFEKGPITVGVDKIDVCVVWSISSSPPSLLSSLSSSKFRSISVDKLFDVLCSGQKQDWLKTG